MILPEGNRVMALKAEFINPFLEATQTVLKTMASLTAVPGKPYIKKGVKCVGDISGIVGSPAPWKVRFVFLSAKHAFSMSSARC